MTTTVTFRPRRDGLPFDPVTEGGAVSLLRVYTDVARATVPVATSTTAERVGFGRYRFTIPNLPDGTYYTTVIYTERAGDPPTTDANDRFTLPVPDPVIRRLRALIAEPTDVRYTDADLAMYLDANTDERGRLDLYAAAADVWEEKAAGLAASASGAPQVASVSTSDQSITYGQGSPAQFAQQMARAMRARSNAKTVRVTSPGAYPWHLRPEQVDAGIGHAVGWAPEAADLAGRYDR